MDNCELLAVKLALAEWRHWLEETKQPFIVLTDNKNLEYLCSVKYFNSKFDSTGIIDALLCQVQFHLVLQTWLQEW